MIKLKDLLTEGKITSDVDRAAKKYGIKFKKKVKTVFTNDFTGVNEPGEKVKYDDWMEYNPQNYKSQGMGLVSEFMGKYIMLKNNKNYPFFRLSFALFVYIIFSMIDLLAISASKANKCFCTSISIIS